MPVLLADDDEGLRAAFARRLRTFTEVVTAATVDEAQELLASRNDWSAFLFDLRFGPSDLEGGIHLLAAARQRFASTPAFLVTGFMDPNVVLRAAALDARCWPKSLGREHFAQIAKILERERERETAHQCSSGHDQHHSAAARIRRTPGRAHGATRARLESYECAA
jgi:DNA-binding NtrC family response regulator